MENNGYFKKALSAFTADTAYVAAIRHLYDTGMDALQIEKHLTFPVSRERIEQVIRDYEEEQKHSDEGYTYVQETNPYGRRSFRRVKKE